MYICILYFWKFVNFLIKKTNKKINKLYTVLYNQLLLLQRHEVVLSIEILVLVPQFVLLIWPSFFGIYYNLFPILLPIHFSKINSPWLLYTCGSTVLWLNLNTHAKSFYNFPHDENLSGANLLLPVSSDFWVNIITLLQSSAGFWPTLCFFLFICVELICLLGYSSSVIPRNSGTLYQKFELAILFTAISLVSLFAGLHLVKTYLH